MFFSGVEEGGAEVAGGLINAIGSCFKGAWKWLKSAAEKMEIEEASDEETLVGLRDRIGDKIDECLEALRDAFDVRGDIERAKAEVQVLRYLKRMQERIIEKL